MGEEKGSFEQLLGFRGGWEPQRSLLTEEDLLLLLSSVSFSFILFLCTGLGNPCLCHSCDNWTHCSPVHDNCFVFIFLLQPILGRPLELGVGTF